MTCECGDMFCSGCIRNKPSSPRPTPSLPQGKRHPEKVAFIREQKCENCKFFLSVEGWEREGRCRRYPPMFSGQSSRDPEVKKAGWCGEYKESSNG